MRTGNTKNIIIPGYFIVISLILLSVIYAFAYPGKTKQLYTVPQDSLSAEIRSQLQSGSRELFFPKTVGRFYAANNYQQVWLKPQSGTGSTWQAMLMLDCVLQFGLSHADYHPHELMYNKLHEILENPNTISVHQQARFEIMLTDAMINFMNNLHFGKLNPYINDGQQDEQLIDGYDAAALLTNALKQKDLMTAVGNVQPQNSAYVTLQQYMQLRVGQESGDCYQVPESEIRKMAINLNRLRWADLDHNAYIQINIPTFTLTLHEPDSTYNFKVIVGKPQNQTPELNSDITYFTTAPEWKVPNKIFRNEILPKLNNIASYDDLQYAIYDNNGKYIPNNADALKKVMAAPHNYHATQSSGCDNALGLVVFRFPNIYDVFLHDTPEKQLFNRPARDFSHGCIRVEKAAELASLLLKYDGQANKVKEMQRAITHEQTVNFNFKKHVPIRITYITCSRGEWGLDSCKDIYDLDNRLEMALYQDGSRVAAR